MVLVVDHVKNIQRIIDRIKNTSSLFDNGITEGKLREVNFGDPNNNDKLSIKQKPALYVTTKNNIQGTRYSFGYQNNNNQSQVTVLYELVLLAVSKNKTEQSQKQIYELVKNIREFINNDPLFLIPSNMPNPGTDPIFSRCVINDAVWDSERKGRLVTSISFTLLATIGISFLANFPGIGDVTLLSKPNAPEGIVFSDDKLQKPSPNRVITENGNFGSLDVEYESTVSLDDAFRSKFGVEEDVIITTASGSHTYHVKYININPTYQYDSIERTILHMELTSV
jgi:hypothetical protein